MATELNLTNGTILKKGFIGFSWTTFFFGFFVPLLRGDWLWFILILIAQWFSYGFASIVMAFFYNKLYTRKLIEKDGFIPADDYSRQLLIMAGIYKD
ncbi:HrgC protein [Cetobacterium ceti]